MGRYSPLGATVGKDTKDQLEKLLADAHRQGWLTPWKGKYYKFLCPCPEKHAKWSVHLTPSNPNYWLNTRKWLERSTCWKEDP